MAFVSFLEEQSNSRVERIHFNIANVGDKNSFNFEAFRRRVSFLQLNTGKSFTLVKNNSVIDLYNLSTLFKRPNNEIIRPKIKRRDGKSSKWSLEKDFQAFLYGDGFESDEDKAGKERPNGRLAILGADFARSNKKEHGILREFATGAFENEIKDGNRILPTEYVDLISLTTSGELAVIELKLDDSPLEVISQTLDYALFFKCYSKQIYSLLNANQTLGKTINEGDDFSVYMVSNVFHARMKGILPFYGTKGKKFGFTFKQVVLGSSQELF